MNDFKDLYGIVMMYTKEITDLRKKAKISRCHCEKCFYSDIADRKMNQMRAILKEMGKHIECFKDGRQVKELKVFTIEELAQYDGSNGKPAYIAVGDKVYDVSFAASWGGGTHFGLQAGTDVTAEYNNCHGGSDILNKLEVVGVVKK